MLFHRYMGGAAQTEKPSVMPPAASVLAPRSGPVPALRSSGTRACGARRLCCRWPQVAKFRQRGESHAHRAHCLLHFLWDEGGLLQAHGKAAQTVKPSVMPHAAAAHMLDEEVHDAVPQAHAKAAQTVEPSGMPHAAAAHMLEEEVPDAAPQAPGKAAQTVETIRHAARCRRAHARCGGARCCSTGAWEGGADSGTIRHAARCCRAHAR